MSVPLTGAAILLIGISLFILSPRLLYAAMILSTPFSATAVANLHLGGDAKSVPAWLFLGGLWLLREILSGLPPWRKKGWLASARPRWALLTFLGAVFASLSVPLILNGTSWIPDPDPVSSQTVSLQFGAFNLTQTAYLATGVLLAVFVAAENIHPSKIFRTLRLYVSSCVFVSVWGLLQLGCNLTGHTYPAYIFNTAANPSALGYKQALSIGVDSLGRVSSAALEPSVLAQELLISFVVLLVCEGLHRPLFSKGGDYVSLVLTAAALGASTSTTAYVGGMIALLFATITLSRAGKTPKHYLLLTAGAIGTTVILLAAVPLLRQVGIVAILDKTQSYSGLERSRSLSFAAHDFLRYPILGAGWHAVTCWDLVLLLLANTGVVGLVAFGSFLLPVISRLWKQGAKGGEACVVLFAAVALIVSLCEAAGLTYSGGYVWLVFGLGAGAASGAQFDRARLVGMSQKAIGGMCKYPSRHVNLGNCS